jgi:hypothetical protein
VINRRAFLGAVATGLAVKPFAGPTLAAATDHGIPAVQDPRYRLLKRLRHVDLLVLERHRQPGGWDGRGGTRYLHRLWCRGVYHGTAGDWDIMHCSVEIRASRPDPVLRVVGVNGLRCEETSFVLTHVVRVRFPAALGLEIYLEAANADDVLVVAGLDGIDVARQDWIAPSPHWIDR